MRNQTFRAATIGAAALFAAVWLTPTHAFGGVLLNAAADAGLREESPETPIGAGSLGTSGTVTELAVRAGSGQNRVSIMRFDLTGLGLADIGAAADLNLHVRGNTWLNNVAGGVRIFGLQPTAPLQNWNEQAVFYRDAGDAIPVLPVGGHPGSQPSVTGLIPGVSAPPQPITTVPSWNSNSNDPNRAPGLAHENAPFSQVVQDENQARYGRNLQRHQGTLVGDYEPYTNQPTYTQAVVNGTYPDLVSMPLSTFHDLDSTPTAPVGSLTRFLGFLDFSAQTAASRPQGFQFSFTQSSDTAMAALNGTNNSALVQYLTDLINAGATSATFLVSSKLAGDAGPVTGSQMLFASKDFEVTTGAGALYGPKLGLNVPEPTGLALFGAAALTTAFRRRRRA